MFSRYLKFTFFLLIIEALFTCNVLATGQQNIVATELKKLHNDAEVAFSSKNYNAAREAFMRIIELSGDNFRQTREYFDMSLRLAEAEKELGNFSESERLISNLASKVPPTDFLPRIAALKAQILTERGKPVQAYKVFKQLEGTVPINQWEETYKAFFLSLEFSLNQKYESAIKNAERLVDGGFFLEATPLYQEVLDAIANDDYPAVAKSPLKTTIVAKIQYLLAKAYYEGGQYKSAIAILKKTPKDNKVYQNTLYLLTKAYNKIHLYHQAIESGMTYLNSDQPEQLRHYYHIEWEMGYAYYMQDQLKDAAEHFSLIPADTKEEKLYYLSRLYLARIYLKQQNYAAMEDILKPLISLMPADDILRYELAYLRGEAFFNRKDFKTASILFEQAMPKRNKEQANWLADTLYNLGWCYLKLGEQKPDDPTIQSKYFSKAEDVFSKLADLKDSDRAYIGLARTYFLRSNYLKDPTAYEQVNNILLERKLKSTNSQAEALLLRAEVADTFTAKEELYQLLTQDEYRMTPAYPQGWYLKGLNEFQEASRLYDINPSDPVALEMYKKAIQSLVTAFELLKSNDPSRAGLALKYAAQAYYNENTVDARLKALDILDTLLTQNNAIFKVMPHQDEVLFLRGLVASRLIGHNADTDFNKIVEDSLNRVVNEFPEGNYVDKALNLLGTLYFHQGNYEQAEKIFVQLAHAFPHSQYAGDAWFWASEAADWQHKPPETVKFYRLQVFEKYPTSKHAAEAYFNYYTFSEYLQGSRNALKHLKEMSQKYQDTPPMIVAYYLTGLDNKKATDAANKDNYETSLDNFELSAETFDRCYSQGAIAPSNLEYYATIRYRALLECGLICLSQADKYTDVKRLIYLESALEVFKKIVADFQESEHPIAQILTKGTPYARLYEESEFGLAQAYLKMDKYDKAEQVLSKMIDKYAMAKISRGYYLSRTWYELGRIAMQRQEWELSLKLLSHADQAAKDNVLSTEQKLDLWIQQSICHKELADYNDAMLVLSKVINEDAVSSLRVKAMFLRAEIYELEGRDELAKKQLEATTKKGSEWALKAKQKLDKNYGFN